MQGAVAASAARPAARSRRKRSSRRSSSVASPSAGTRAAASSSASGMPSSRRQISATSAVLAAESLKRAIGRCRTLREQRHRGVLRRHLLRNVGLRGRQCREPVDELAGDAQRRLAGDQHAHAARLRQQLRQRGGQRLAEVLGTVEDQQQREAAQCMPERREVIPVIRQRQPQRYRDRRGNVLGDLDGAQRHPRGRQARLVRPRAPAPPGRGASCPRRRCRRCSPDTCARAPLAPPAVRCRARRVAPAAAAAARGSGWGQASAAPQPRPRRCAASPAGTSSSSR